MPVTVDAEVIGLQQVQANMAKIVEELHGTPILNTMRDATLLILRDARINAPVDTGRLRASITPEVKAEPPDVIGIVGSNVEYAPFQEFGTKRMAGKHYLERAVEKNKDRIQREFEKVVNQVINK